MKYTQNHIKEAWIRWKTVIILFGIALILAILLAAFGKNTPETEETVRVYDEGQLWVESPM